MNQYLIQLADRAVTAYEADVARKQEEWVHVKKAAEARERAILRLAESGITGVPNDADIVDLDDIIGGGDNEDRRD